MGPFPPLLLFGKSLRKIDVLWLFGRIHYGSCLVLNFWLLGSFWSLINSLYWFVQIFYFISWFNLCSLYARGHYPLVLGCLICWHIVVHSILLGSLYLCIACNFSYFWFYSFMPFYFLDMSGLKVCQFYFIFSKNQLLISLIFSIAF